MTSSHVVKHTISLCLIAKNEEKNVNRLLDSVEGCFDEIIFVDTGSTDNTKKLALERGCKVFDFTWINDFSAARNFSFSKATSDYVMWMDLDDVLYNPEGFKLWTKTSMPFYDMFLATYHYALDRDLKPIISFERERVFRRSVNPKWKFALHEGIMPEAHWNNSPRPVNHNVWAINHMRTADDIAADKSRNITILEDLKAKNKLDSRLEFYLGKELYEIKREQEAIAVFENVLKKNDLELHDRILSCQYGCYAATACANQLKEDFKEMRKKYFNKAVEFALEGLKLNSNRAELYVAIADTYIMQNDLISAIPYFSAAKHCMNPKKAGSPYEGAIYSFQDCYGLLPCLMLAKIYFNVGKLDLAIKEAKEAQALGSAEAKAILEDLYKYEKLSTLDNNQVEVDEIVFTTPPQTAYEFDENLYKTKGMGGSETALIEMAKHLKELTGKKVKVFNMRKENIVAESGVEYISNTDALTYFSKYKPKVHIAWRHNIKLTNAKTYLWCHDLKVDTVEILQNFDKILCLSEFHKDYVKSEQGVIDEKIIITDNGLTPDKFKFKLKPKNINKLVWMSSPDRGLERAMLVCDEVKKEHPDIELHVYYGLDNLYKYGLVEMANKLKNMMEQRSYVKYHGFTEQSKMYQEVSDAVVWVHPCNFIETNCITAKEMLALNIYPVTRRLGALANTLAEAEAQGNAILIDQDCNSSQAVKVYAHAVCEVLENKKWEKISFDVEKYSWKNVAKSWLNFLEM